MDREPSMPVRRLFIAMIAVCLVQAAVSVSHGQNRDEFDRQRHKMVSDMIEREGIHNPRVLDAMRTVPRHEFVLLPLRSKAYADAAWSIGYRQTISPPFVVAYMTESLDPQPSDRVLEIGTGSGYQAAILSRLVKEVYSIEIVEPLGKSAERRLKHLGYHNVKTKVGDGYLGWPEHAPFDKIIVTCSPEDVPKPLVDQLKEGGRMIIPLGERYHQDVNLLEKKEGKLVRKHLIPTLFVPMTGRSEHERMVKPDLLHPILNNGGFEVEDDEHRPAGWHYQRQVTLSEQDAQEGRRCARFDNEDPGRVAQLLQGLAADGRRFASLHFTLKARSDAIVDGPESYQKAGVMIHFYDDNRRIVGNVTAAHFIGSSRWHSIETTVAVPHEAREAILRIGLNGATGHLYVDDVQMTTHRR
jgi:protein-L-isoaspartate(D-aspartate) O-methyltransferase